MRLSSALMLVFVLTACKYDETISGYSDPGVTWVLTELDGKAFSPRATITFPSKGKVMGHSPCNSYSSNQTVPLPWFKLGPIMATKMACPDLAAETRFFTALEAMSLAETLGDTLILSNEDGREMVFKAAS